MIAEELYVVNDTILVRPAKDSDYKQADNGLWVKPTVRHPGSIKSLEIIKGYVMKRGDGYPINSEKDNITGRTETSFIPLQVKEGDEVYFVETTGNVLQLNLEGQVYYILKQHNILFARTIID